MNEWFQVVLGVMIGCGYAKWGLGADAGTTPRIRPTAWPVMYRGMIMIPLGRTARALHLHHWLVYAVLLPWLAPWPVAWGAALTLVVQAPPTARILWCCRRTTRRWLQRYRHPDVIYCHVTDKMRAAT